MSTQSVFLFPGQGSQTVGMGKDFFDEFSEVVQTFEEASDALGFDMAKLCFEDPHGQLNLTEFTQPAILTVSTAILRTLQNRAILKPSFFAGHSLGEYSALVALGAFSFSDALKAVNFRGKAMQKAVPVGVGGMAAYIGNQSVEVIALCKEISTQDARVEVANDNCPSQLVLSGHLSAVEKACQLIAEKKLGRAKQLPVSAPFHSSLMAPAADEMREFFKNIPLKSFGGKIVANVDACIHTKDSYSIDMLIKQIASPVLWTQSLKCIHQNQQHVSDENYVESENIWIEVGPGKVLQGLVKKTFEHQKCLVTNDVDALHEIINL